MIFKIFFIFIYYLHLHKTILTYNYYIKNKREINLNKSNIM